MGIFWSAPPFTLNPNLPRSSGGMVITTRSGSEAAAAAVSLEAVAAEVEVEEDEDTRETVAEPLLAGEAVAAACLAWCGGRCCCCCCCCAPTSVLPLCPEVLVESSANLREKKPPRMSQFPISSRTIHWQMVHKTFKTSPAPPQAHHSVPQKKPKIFGSTWSNRQPSFLPFFLGTQYPQICSLGRRLATSRKPLSTGVSSSSSSQRRRCKNK